MIYRLSSLVVVVGLVAAAMAQDAAIVSGPQKDKPIPGPCEVFNLTGGKHKDRYHCLVCEYGLDPVVMVFTQEPTRGEDDNWCEALSLDIENSQTLVNELDACIARNGEAGLRAFVVILSPRFRSFANAGWWSRQLASREKIIKETLTRSEFLKEMAVRASAMEKSAVILACAAPEATRAYNLNPRAQTTVIFYRNLQVVESYPFEGNMTDADVKRIIGDVDKELKKRPNKK